ncbi:MAG: GNAT family N-acetyltransferase [Clostridiales bacterium]|nr:GNAT family N-acetyltransferase [Clostridiales bacterium]
MNTRIIDIREHPECLDAAADYFHATWGVPRELYVESMQDSLKEGQSIPRWFLLLRDDAIIGGFGLIENDFMVREDLCPWLCALHIEPAERGQALGGQLLTQGRREAAKLGYDTVYLNTDHIGYYEKYGWRYMGDFMHQEGIPARVYAADAIFD